MSHYSDLFKIPNLASLLVNTSSDAPSRSRYPHPCEIESPPSAPEDHTCQGCSAILPSELTSILAFPYYHGHAHLCREAELLGHDHLLKLHSLIIDCWFAAHRLLCSNWICWRTEHDANQLGAARHCRCESCLDIFPAKSTFF